MQLHANHFVQNVLKMHTYKYEAGNNAMIDLKVFFWLECTFSAKIVSGERCQVTSDFTDVKLGCSTWQ